MQKEIAGIVIIGAGAAGLMAGASAAETVSAKSGGASARPKVIILEKMPRPGRKIIITGKGRCNMTNLKDWQDFSAHVHPKANFLKNAFYNFTPYDTMEFFSRNGLETVAERGDRVFPAEGNSKDVVDALVKAAENAGAQILTGKEVSGIDVNGDGRFTVETAEGDTFVSPALVITTGGLSYPATGSTGDGLKWASAMGLRTVPCFPSLTALVPKGYKREEISGKGSGMKGHVDRCTPLSDTGSLLNGNRLKNVSLKISIDGTEVMDEFGDLDFTDGGLEGPLGFKASRRCVKALLNGSKVRAAIDMKPAVPLSELDTRIMSLWNGINEEAKNRNKSRDERMRILLSRLLPSDLIRGFLKYCPANDVKKVGKALKNWEMDICGYVGYERCVITAGGVSTDEISPKTMEAKAVPGLYIAGELLDIDGDTGGYNLQCAFSTGRLAGQSAAEKILNLR